jgi:hypothetical protein
MRPPANTGIDLAQKPAPLRDAPDSCVSALTSFAVGGRLHCGETSNASSLSERLRSVSPFRRTNDKIVVNGAHAGGDLGSDSDSFLLRCRLHDPPQLDRPVLHDHVDQRWPSPRLGVELRKHLVADLRIVDLRRNFNLLAQTGQGLQQVWAARPLAARLTRLLRDRSGAELLRRRRRRCFLSLHFLFKDLT